MTLILILLALTNYTFAKFIQKTVISIDPSISSAVAIALPWLLIAAIPCLLFIKDSGLYINFKTFKDNYQSIGRYFLFVTLGLILFVAFDLTRFFHNVPSPIIFFLITPIVEELIFRGFIYGRLAKFTKYSPVIMTSILFALHHLQYTGYIPTPFAIFQIIYTFFLGLFLGKMREKSGSIYPGLLCHILINFVAVYF